MAQKNTAAGKTPRKTIELPAKTLAQAPAKAPAKAAKVAEKPAATAATAPPRQAPNTHTPSGPRKDPADLAAVGRENVEAYVMCGTIVAKGVEALGTEVMSFTQASIEADLAAAKGIMSAKTLNEAIGLQTGLVQARIERMTSETAKLSELSMRFASLAMAPLRSQFDANTSANAWSAFRPLGL